MTSKKRLRRELAAARHSADLWKASAIGWKNVADHVSDKNRCLRDKLNIISAERDGLQLERDACRSETAILTKSGASA